jgi:thymidylate synthase (FAD)
MMNVDPNAHVYSTSAVPLLDGGYIRLIEDWGYGDAKIAEAGIVEAARQSTQKGFVDWLPYMRCKRCDHIWMDGTNESRRNCNSSFVEHDWEKHKDGDVGLLRYLHNNTHATPFEFAGMIVEVQAPIMVFREWHRHRTQSYNEMSARYAPLPNNNYIPTEERCMMVSATNKQAGAAKGADVLTHEKVIEWLGQLQEAYDVSERVYQNGLQWGIPKEIARLPIGVGRFSRMRAQANLRNWLAFMTLRSERNPNAQWEIRQFGNAVADLCRQRFPRTMALFDGAVVMK